MTHCCTANGEHEELCLFLGQRQSGQRWKRRTAEPRANCLKYVAVLHSSIGNFSFTPTQHCRTFNSNKELDVESVGFFILKVGQWLGILKAYKKHHSLNKQKGKIPRAIPVTFCLTTLCCTPHLLRRCYCSCYCFACSHAHTFKDLSEQM